MSTLPTAYLTKLGPLPGLDGSSIAIYVAFSSDGKELARLSNSPPDDAAGTRTLAAKVASHSPRCALDLAEVGAPLGLDVGDMPPPVAEARAIAGYRECVANPLDVGDAAVRELLTAAVECKRAEPWKKFAIFKRFRAKETLRSPNGKVVAETAMLLQVLAGNGFDGPLLEIEVDADPRHRSTVSPLRVQVRLASTPGWVADAVERAYGAYVCPHVAYKDMEQLETAEDSQILLAAAAMRAAADRMRGGAGKGRAGHKPVSYELAVDFTKSVPLAPAPTEFDPSDMRSMGPVIANALATELPLPHYDEYVCVILERDDPQTPKTMLLLDQTAAVVGRDLPKGFDQVYKTAIGVEQFIARWMRADHMAKMLAHNDLPPARVAALHAKLPPRSLRVLLFGSHRAESFFVDVAPVKTTKMGAKSAPAGEDDFSGSWRDALAYVPKPLPSGWSVGEQHADGAVSISAGPLSVVLATEPIDGGRWVKAYFAEHPDGRPVTRDEAREVYGKLVGTARFTEMNLIPEDAERISLVGARHYAATVATARPRTVTSPSRSARDTQALLERAKGPIAEIVARIRDNGGTLREYCVIIEAKAPRTGPDGIVLTRARMEQLFTPANDPFHIRARFEEPRPLDECVIFVKHPEGIEEVYVSLEAVEQRPEAEA